MSDVAKEMTELLAVLNPEKHPVKEDGTPYILDPVRLSRGIVQLWDELKKDVEQHGEAQQ